MKNYIFFAVLFIAFSPQLHAGFIELSIQSEQQQTSVNENTKNTKTSLSGSVAYYFMASSALQLSYATGNHSSEGITSTSNSYEQVINYDLLGLDIVFSFGDRESAFRPYIKAGVANIDKEFQYKESGSSTQKVEASGLSMTSGIGFKFHLTQTFALKFSYDLWRGPINDPDNDPTVDTTIKAGFSWFL